MILADKIIHLRKKHQMTQEELAEKLNVSRQSISKWEGSLSTPDLNKIVTLSKIFSVSTDYLLNDDAVIDDIEGRADSNEDWVSVSLETVNNFLRDRKQFAKRIGMGVVILIFSIIPIIVFSSGSLSEFVAPNVGQAIGLGSLFLLLAIGVGLIIQTSLNSYPYEFLEDKPFELEYGVVGFLEKEKENYRPIYTRNLTIGIGLIFVGIIPLVVTNLLFPDIGENNMGLVVGLWLMLLALALFVIINTTIYWSDIEGLLEDNGKVRTESMDTKIGSVYWPIVVAIFIGYSLITNDWGRSWIIWPIAGVLFAALTPLYNMIKGK